MDCDSPEPFARCSQAITVQSGITVEQLDREREYFDSHDFEVVGLPAS
jgi:hypothetical protein